MLFPTIQFAVFLTIVFACNWLLMRRPLAWRVFMLMASWVFYGFWDWRFTALLAAATGANWWFAREIARSDNDRRRRRLLRWAIAFDLGL
ncbi:MAG: MBOAT family protein, partial [Acidimicrobiia bacterium]|nr:MBOAT family protein [Acidimicrobiia bacterium]